MSRHLLVIVSICQLLHKTATHCLFEVKATMEKWTGKVALVTGASAGIGMGIALELVKRGLKVIAVSRRSEIVEAAKEDLPEEYADNLHAVKLDITIEEDVHDTFNWIREQFGCIHILINSAGVLGAGTLSNGPISIFRRTIDVNFFGLCIMTTNTIQLMKENEIDLGHIIHINSIAGHKIASNSDFLRTSCNVYPGTKHAVTALTDVLRKEVNSMHLNIRVSSISPGVVKTEIFEANDWDPNGMIFSQPHLDVEDINNAIIYALEAPPTVNISELTIQCLGDSL